MLPLHHALIWSTRRDSNPQQPAWKAGTLPLRYWYILSVFLKAVNTQPVGQLRSLIYPYGGLGNKALRNKSTRLRFLQVHLEPAHEEPCQLQSHDNIFRVRDVDTHLYFSQAAEGARSPYSSLKFPMVLRVRLELTTSRLSVEDSNQLNYRSIWCPVWDSNPGHPP